MGPENHWSVEEAGLPKVHVHFPCGSLPGCRTKVWVQHHCEVDSLSDRGHTGMWDMAC